MHFVKQKYKLLRKAKSKIENPIHSFRQILCFSSHKNLKVKLLWAGACKRKRGHFLYRLFCRKWIFLNIYVLSQCMVCWIHFQNIHTFMYQKILLHTNFCLFLKSPKTFSISVRLNFYYFKNDRILWVWCMRKTNYDKSTIWLWRVL